MKEIIAKVVEAGGLVSFPCRFELDDHYADARIVTVNGVPPDRYLVTWPEMPGYRRFTTLDQAVDFYVKLVFSRKNVGLGIARILDHKMNDRDLDELGDKDVRALVDRYFAEKFLTDYPFAG